MSNPNWFKNWCPFNKLAAARKAGRMRYMKQRWEETKHDEIYLEAKRERERNRYHITHQEAQ